MQDIIRQKSVGRAYTLAALLMVTVLPLALWLGSAANADQLPATHKQTNTTKAVQAIAANPAGALNWQHDYHKALSLASANNKLLLIDLATDWCGWCKKLDRDTYTNADVQAFLNKQFVLLKLNAEDGADGEAVAKKFHVRGYPCTIIMDAQGKAKGVIYGYFSPKEYPDEINKALNKG